ncbi:DNA gyrase subunit A [Halobaculum sp. MBLA0147]|uniref:DNA gyrase subunit A n=1 Tax=Halobaculum sp. MBLA0147 TaxID=3079934 RepID=UPI003525B110
MSSDDYQRQADAEAARIETVRIEDEMEQSYIDYAMSVIAGRALPDVRDGLKPVHRRILYAMHEMGVSSGSGHRKSSSVVGETMGNYHPHGDQAIYDTLVNMAQDFSMRYPLVDGQGNFGSMDGDPAAAMRYTEARMSPISEELLADIERDTVDFVPNYDDRLEEPEVLPAAFPNLLVNGSTGIAVGMSTKIPPHNLGEVIDATIHLIENPDCDVRELIDTESLLPGEGGTEGPIEGPDFPTGANVVGSDGIIDAYTTGRGRLRVRATFEEEEEAANGRERIVVTELPYQENKARIVERIAEDVNEGTIEGIADLRDESDRDGVRIVIDLKRGASRDVVKNQLLEHHLESTFGVITLALVDGQPKVLTLKEVLEEYVAHRKEVVTRRTEDELAEAEERAHILEGRLRALENVDDVVETIRESEDRDAARAALESDFAFSEEQAAHIVRMQLGSLTSMEATEIREEYDEVTSRIERLEEILADESELLDVIVDELEAIKAEYDEPRRTGFVRDTGTVTREDLIPEEDMLVVVSEDDYVKRVPAEEFRPQRRGGKGVIGADLKEGDRVASAFVASTHDNLLCFTDHGQVYRLKTYEVPEYGRTARGTSMVNVLDLDDGEQITAVVNCGDFTEGSFVTMVTRQGYIKRTAGEEFENILSTGIRAISLSDGDELADVEVTDGTQDVVIGTRDGMAIRFDETDARAMGRTARGVRGISLEGDDEVAGVAAVDDDVSWTLTVTANGYGKRTNVDAYRRQNRNGKGLVDIDTGERNGPVRAIETVAAGDHLFVTSEQGQVTRTRVEDVSTVGRNTMGVTVMEVADGDTVGSVAVMRDGDGDEEGATADETDAAAADDAESADDETEPTATADD